MNKWLALVLASILLVLSSGCADVKKAEKKANDPQAQRAAFILKQAGMDPDLSSYVEVYLVEFTYGDGVERAAVHVDGKVVLPGGAGQ
ncbi:hypothetical protein IEQ44_05360 [Nocardioides sp. Y6]|uniref:PepSY domain-containing protein n=1 Tax=Nocardioides malaquae TaxID=2773426 RepID=A0ABR9RR79_9ACTN|nr:hypothetical protein [Nocardioides malaquae]MBE7324072.1 hypothetical protein [Nocardioides malaquae]